jgi:predicted permease
MSAFSRLRSWSRAILQRHTMENAMEAEMRFHLDARTEELQRKGTSEAEARRLARLEFGGIDRHKEECRQSLGLRMSDEFRADLRYAFRVMRKNPGVSLVAVLCLTLAIGANAAVFSWIEGILLRPFPLVAHQNRMMAITGTQAGSAGAAGDAADLSWPDFVDLEKNSASFDWFIVDRIMGATLSVGERATIATGSIVSANYFDAIGVKPILGRGFEPDENYGRNAHPVTVISYQLWKDAFRRDPNVIGRMQMLNGMPHTIIGVAPEGFYGTFVGWAMQFWVPVSMQERFDSSGPGYKLEDRSARWIEAYVRLKPGVTSARAQQELSAQAKRLEQLFPEINRGRGVKLFPLWQTPFNNAGALLPTLGAALAVAALVLLIACANVSNLLLVRAFARRQEMAVRLSLGAARARLLRQLLTEGLVLSAISACGGLIVARWCRNLLVLLLPRRGSVAMNLPGEIDWRVLLLVAGVCLAATLLVGLVPALQGSKVELAAALKTESPSVLGDRRRASVRAMLVLAQVALSFLLLTGAGLLVRSLNAIQNTSPGFEARGLLTAWVNLAAAGYDAQRAKNFDDALAERLQSVSGIQAVAFARKTPFTYPAYSSASVATDRYRAAPDEQPRVDYNEVGPGYFATLGIPLLAGRDFTRDDNETAPLVAIVNETMATKYWPGEDPVGARVLVDGRAMRVVGVAKTTKYRSLTEAATPFFYVPLRQNFSAKTDLSIRTKLNAEAITRVLTREMRALDRAVSPYGVVRMEEQLARTSAVQRTAALMIGALGVLAIVLAAVGLYSVMAFAVSERRRELGLRMALGARPGTVLRLIMARGFALTAAGIVLGAAVALGTTRLLGYLLYRVSPRDPLAFSLAIVVMLVTAAAACFIPAWQASRTDPLEALRS